MEPIAEQHGFKSIAKATGGYGHTRARGVQMVIVGHSIPGQHREGIYSFFPVGLKAFGDAYYNIGGGEWVLSFLVS